MVSPGLNTDVESVQPAQHPVGVGQQVLAVGAAVLLLLLLLPIPHDLLRDSPQRGQSLPQLGLLGGKVGRPGPQGLDLKKY